LGDLLAARILDAPVDAVYSLYGLSRTGGVAKEHALGEPYRLEEPLDGAPGSLPVKNNQSTALIAANSAAPPAKNSRMASGLPQMRRVTAEDKVGWYMRCPSMVGDNGNPDCADSEYNRGCGVVTVIDER
jgi:hypothetical protein